MNLTIHPSRRFLMWESGTPFFYLGDTAWELFHRLNRQEAAMYLKDRATKGFTVIQAVALAELDGLHTPNPYGQTPLINDDPTRPNEEYWKVERGNQAARFRSGTVREAASAVAPLLRSDARPEYSCDGGGGGGTPRTGNPRQRWQLRHDIPAPAQTCAGAYGQNRG